MYVCEKNSWSDSDWFSVFVFVLDRDFFFIFQKTKTKKIKLEIQYSILIIWYYSDEYEPKIKPLSSSDKWIVEQKKNESIQIDQMFLMPSLCFDAILILTIYKHTNPYIMDRFIFIRAKTKTKNESFAHVFWLVVV